MFGLGVARDPKRSALVLPVPPDASEQYIYVWRSLPFLAGAITVSALSLVIAQAWFEVRDAALLPLVVAPMAAYTVAYIFYQLLSVPLNFAGRDFDLVEHQTRVDDWLPERFPSVDLFLPICGESMDLLRNTWGGVRALVEGYPGIAHVYVLDDGDSDEAWQSVPEYGFTYIRRPVHEFKKAGNLNYGFARTSAEHVVVFDADFVPRPDFLAHTLPYMDDATVGIVQTPQYFRVTAEQTWVERAAGATLEVFYRVVQVSRDRFGSALCVGSNAVYRRAALEPSGGFTLIPYAEDSHTGLDTRRHGYRLVYIPIAVAAGVCPSHLDAYMRQQYRWCCGATSLVWSRHMWSTPMPWRSRLPYVAGWLWNFTTALRTLVVPLVPVGLLAFLPGQIELRNAVLLVPAIITSAVLYPLWHNVPYSPRVWSLTLATGWAQVLGLWDYSRRKVMSWTPSRGPGDATRRFRVGLTLWNGSLALTWIVLAGYRTAQTGSIRFGAVLIFGLLNFILVGRLIVSNQHAE